MLERLASMDPRILRRRFGAAVLSGGLVVLPSACATDRPPCDRSYEITNETSMVNDHLTTPDGNVDVSFNTKDGDVTHVYFEKGTDNKDLTHAELARREAEFALSKTVIKVNIDDNELVLTCEVKPKHV